MKVTAKETWLSYQLALQGVNLSFKFPLLLIVQPFVRPNTWRICGRCPLRCARLSGGGRGRQVFLGLLGTVRLVFLRLLGTVTGRNRG